MAFPKGAVRCATVVDGKRCNRIVKEHPAGALQGLPACAAGHCKTVAEAVATEHDEGGEG